MNNLKQRNKKWINALVCLGFFLLGLFFVRVFTQEEKLFKDSLKEGYIDLRDWDFKENGSIKIQGEWKFYWKRLLSPEEIEQYERNNSIDYIQFPGTWKQDGMDLKYDKHGHATAKIVIDNDYKGSLAVLMPKVISSSRIWINGKEAAGLGTVGEDAKTTELHMRNNIIPVDKNTESMEIVVQMSNYGCHFTGGISGDMIIGDYESITGGYYRKISLDFLVLGCLIMMGLYHIGLYIVRKKDLSPLLFGVACTCMALKSMIHIHKYLGGVLHFIPWEITSKFQGIASQGAVLFFFLFIDYLFKKFSMKKVYSILKYAAVSIIVLQIFLPLNIVVASLVISNVITLLIGGYIIVILFRAVRGREYGAITISLGIGVQLLTAFISFLNSVNIIHTGNYEYIGTLAFVGSQAFLLSKKFTRAFDTVEALSERMVSLNKMKDEFLANTTHELKTPLNGIIGISESLYNDMEHMDSDERRKLSLIISSGRRLSHLVDDILDFSKLKNRDIELDRKSVDIRQIVELVLDVSYNLVGDKELVLKNDIGEDTPYLYGDENRIEQILYNLIGNAIKNTHSGEIRVWAEERRGMVEVFVSDTGVGIPEDRLDIIFQEFQQLGERRGGIGLGLTITKRLVELHKGTIQVESKEGEGSTFKISIPKSIYQKKENSQSNDSVRRWFSSRKNQGKKKLNHGEKAQYKLLVVDDEAINIKVIENYFDSQEYEMVTAVNGGEALRKIQEEKDIDLVILDIMMPDISGYEVCRKIRERYSLVELPVLLLTAYDRDEVIKKGFEVGANDYIFKPVDRLEITTRVRTYLELKKSVENLLLSEMDFLRAQIKPHFLFNTINTIMSFCRSDPNRARSLLLDLSEYLRKSFDFTGKERYVPFTSEMGLVRSYLAIEKARFSKRLNVEYYIEDDIDCLIPPLTIQPLVENAVRHGIAKKREGGTISIIAAKDDGFLRIEVKDDGAGMSRNQIGEIKKGRGRGIGIKNVMERMDLIYGMDLEINSLEGEWTAFSFKIPMVMEGKND